MSLTQTNNMNTEDLLTNLRGLLGLLDGIDVINTKGKKDYLHIEFTVTDAFSRLIVFSLAEASNTILSVRTKYDPCNDELEKNPEKGLIYAFRSGSNPNAIDEFNWLGAHLAWKMYRCDLISSDEEQRYSMMFGAVSRSN